MNDESAHAGVRFPPPLIYLGLLLIGLGIDRAADLPRLEHPLLWLIAGVPILIGVALLLAAAGLFRRHGTALEPWRPSSHFVSSGIYRRTRNPMYLGMALIYFGLAIGFGSLAALLLLPVAVLLIQTQVIAREERYLDARFGEEYRAYRRRVSRWL